MFLYNVNDTNTGDLPCQEQIFLAYMSLKIFNGFLGLKPDENMLVVGRSTLIQNIFGD